MKEFLGNSLECQESCSISIAPINTKKSCKYQEFSRLSRNLLIWKPSSYLKYHSHPPPNHLINIIWKSKTLLLLLSLATNGFHWTKEKMDFVQNKGDPWPNDLNSKKWTAYKMAGGIIDVILQINAYALLKCFVSFASIHSLRQPFIPPIHPQLANSLIQSHTPRTPTTCFLPYHPDISGFFDSQLAIPKLI